MLKKFISVFSILVLFVGMLFNVPTNVVYGAVSEDYKTFSQLDERWADKTYGSGDTLGATGCFVTSVAILMAYANPDLRDVNTWNPYIASTKFTFNGTALNWDSCKNGDETFTFISREAVDGIIHDAKAKVKSTLDDGNYVVVRTENLYTQGSGHYAAVVGWADGKPLLQDPAGGKKNDWTIWETNGISAIYYYKSSKTSSRDAFDGATASPPLTEEEEVKVDRLISEYMLNGMSEKFTGFDVGLDLPVRGDLSQNESNSLEDIKGGIKNNKVSLIGVTHFLSTIVGVAMVFYSFLLLVAYLFDRGNTFLDISFFSLLSFGRYRVWYEDLGVPVGKAPDGKVYCTFGYLLFKAGFVFFVGVALISGFIYTYFYDLYYYIKDSFNLW